MVAAVDAYIRVRGQVVGGSEVYTYIACVGVWREMYCVCWWEEGEALCVFGMRGRCENGQKGGSQVFPRLVVKSVELC